MPNPTLFRSKSSIPTATTRNNAGGRAYEPGTTHELAQFAVTGTFNGTYYISAQDQLTQVHELARKCNPADVARIAVYARQRGLMKDAPVFLLTYLFGLEDKKYFNAAFSGVVNNVGQVRNFVQMVRSGVCGRRSLGSAGKRQIQNFLNATPVRTLYWQSVGGKSNVSLADVLRLARPRPLDSEHDAFFAYVLGKNEEEDWSRLPENIQNFEKFKRNAYDGVPDVPFQRLTSLNLSADQWRSVARNMTWNQLRFNLNQLGRKGVWEDSNMVSWAASQLRDENYIKRSRALPYSMYTSFKHLDSSLPQMLRNAMSDALEVAVANAPVLPGKTLVLVDVSGSMSAAATGSRPGATTRATCSDVASFFAAALMKANPDHVAVQRFNTRVVATNVNPRDSVASITRELSRHSGGTAIQCGIQWAQTHNLHVDNFIILSDTESWYSGGGYWGSSTGSTALAGAFAEYKKRKNRHAKLIAVNCAASTTKVQAPNDTTTLNVGGLNDAVFKVISSFINSRGQDHWENILREVLPDLR